MDGDGLSDAAEFVLGTNPIDPDSDGDGIDDGYEASSPFLNPVDPSDALMHPDNSPLTYLQIYRLSGRNLVFGEAHGREVSVFNFGQSSAQVEAISPEISLYNSNPGSAPPPTDLSEIFSREVTVWNFGASSTRIEAVSQELSIYNAFPGSGTPATDLAQVFSRETSLFNFGLPSAQIEGISHEASVFNFGQPSANVEAISGEVSILNFEEPIIP